MPHPFSFLWRHGARRLGSALALGALLLLLGACQPAAAPPAASAPIRIGAYYWPGMYWVDIAHHQGWFREAGLQVEWVDTNADYFASFDAVVEGKLDIVAFTLFDLVRYNAQGKPLVGFLASDDSNGADALVARPGIASVRALAGKKLGISKGTYLEYMWTIVATRAGLAPGAVQLVDLPGEKADQALGAGSVDAVFTWQPIAGQAQAAVKGRMLFDSSQIAGLSPVVYASRSDFVRQRPAELHKLLQVWQRSTAFIRSQPEAAYAIVAQVNRKTVAEVQDLARLDRILDLDENRAAFSLATGLGALHSSARRMNDFQIQAQLSTQQLDTTTLLDARFVNALGRGSAKEKGRP